MPTAVIAQLNVSNYEEKNMKEILLPLIVSVVSVVFTAYITIQITHSKSKEEALDSLKLIVTRGLAVVWSVWLFYSIIKFVNSDEVLTRLDVFTLVMYVFSLAIMFLNILINRILSMIDRILEQVEKLRENNRKHMEITEKLGQCVVCSEKISDSKQIKSDK